MQLLPNNPFKLTKKTLLVLSIALVLVVGLFLLNSSRSKQSKSSSYHDNTSGETVTNIPGKAPDTYGTTPGEPIYLGMSKLLDHGLTLNQLNGTKQAFFSYSKSLGTTIKEVSVDVSSIQSAPFDPQSGSPIRTLTFKVKINRDKTYDARLDYSGLHTIHLYLKDADGKQIYDSGDTKF